MYISQQQYKKQTLTEFVACKNNRIRMVKLLGQYLVTDMTK